MHPQRMEALHTLVRYTTHIYHIEATCSLTDRRENTKLGGIYNPTRATVKNISRWTFVFSEEVDKRLSYGPRVKTHSR